MESQYGFVPNLGRSLAPSPNALEAYTTLSKLFEASSLSDAERQVVLLTASRFNECEYCTSVHSTTAEKTGLEWPTIEKIRNRESLETPRLEALRSFTEAVLTHDGIVPEDVWTEFTESGFQTAQALEVVLGVTLKTLTNSVNRMIETPLDDQFQKRAWSAEMSHATTA